METNNIKLFRGEFFLPVDYDEDFEDLLERGNYASYPGLSEEDFQPVMRTEQSGEIMQIARFVNYPSDDYSKQSRLEDLLRYPYRHATLRELASYALIQREGRLSGVAYGSIYKTASGEIKVPYFSDACELRRLHAFSSKLDLEKEVIFGRILAIRVARDPNEHYRWKIESFNW